MPSVFINWWALLAAVLVNIIIGIFWFSKSGFGERRSKAAGSPAYAVMVITALIQAWILVHFVRYAGALSFLKGAETGFFLWLGFVAASCLAYHMYDGRSWRHWRTAAGYFLAVMLINGGLLAAWR